MTAALVAPLTPTERERLVGVVDEALTSFGLQSYSILQADLALAHVGFNAAVRERAIGLANAENRRLRVALTIALQDVLAVQGLLDEGRHESAGHAIAAMLPDLRVAAHKMQPGKLPLSVTVLEHARERRDGAR
ncbi:hypothetical protein A3862_27275 [Methylobacterium sp. XJLW]|jgi:hypothetical protein|uniref:hypothetical protein n=1 Tax=Methylobacterium sp. XJLW TaxID=739141 RepID=UPI000DAAFF9A|nr:hypothetical protein [Methylobacterium sp. XJLW]AWV18783.1 hypothetical protein A3862_27275 [Methylobacterium sp. XJLW]